MRITFTYNPAMEFINFRAAFGSMNHAKPSPRQELFFSRFSELTEANAVAFAADYLRETHIDPAQTIESIEHLWRPVEKKFFQRAGALFSRPLPMDYITVYLTVHDRCSYNYELGYFFIHTNLKAVTKTIMHELWHFYYFAFYGGRVVHQYGKKASNDLKEALTVLLNVEFADLMPGVRDVGYPQHSELRSFIQSTFETTHSIDTTIQRTLPRLA